MAYSTRQPSGSPSAWAIARVQHGVITRRQLLALGLTDSGIKHRVTRGRLHLVMRGVYVVGRSEVTPNGRRMVAILGCGGDLDLDGVVELRPERQRQPAVVLSHNSAAELMKIGREPVSAIEVSTTSPNGRHVPGVHIYRRQGLRRGWYGFYERIPVTSPVQTLIDLATRHGRRTMERSINEADKLGLVRTDELRTALDGHAGERGVARLRLMLDQRTFRFTRSELERAFLPLVGTAGLPMPRTSVHVSGHEVDFHFPDLRLVVETDGLTYHRTPAEQAKDRERDQDHIAAGLTPLRFTHAQIKFEPDRVVRILRATAASPRTRALASAP